MCAARCTLDIVGDMLIVVSAHVLGFFAFGDIVQKDEVFVDVRHEPFRQLRRRLLLLKVLLLNKLGKSVHGVQMRGGNHHHTYRYQ